jgi:hypothetical protein
MELKAGNLGELEMAENAAESCNPSGKLPAESCNPGGKAAVGKQQWESSKKTAELYLQPRWESSGESSAENATPVRWEVELEVELNPGEVELQPR